MKQHGGMLTDTTNSLKNTGSLSQEKDPLETSESPRKPELTVRRAGGRPAHTSEADADEHSGAQAARVLHGMCHEVTCVSHTAPLRTAAIFSSLFSFPV